LLLVEDDFVLGCGGEPCQSLLCDHVIDGGLDDAGVVASDVFFDALLGVPLEDGLFPPGYVHVIDFGIGVLHGLLDPALDLGFLVNVELLHDGALTELIDSGLEEGLLDGWEDSLEDVGGGLGHIFGWSSSGPGGFLQALFFCLLDVQFVNDLLQVIHIDSYVGWDVVQARPPPDEIGLAGGRFDIFCLFSRRLGELPSEGLGDLEIGEGAADPLDPSIPELLLLRCLSRALLEINIHIRDQILESLVQVLHLIYNHY